MHVVKAWTSAHELGLA
jgi:hypothetical protein